MEDYFEWQKKDLVKYVRELEAALVEIRDREWVENVLDPQWAPMRARDAVGTADESRNATP